MVETIFYGSWLSPFSGPPDKQEPNADSLKCQYVPILLLCGANKLDSSITGCQEWPGHPKGNIKTEYLYFMKFQNELYYRNSGSPVPGTFVMPRHLLAACQTSVRVSGGSLAKGAESWHGYPAAKGSSIQVYYKNIK